MIFSWGHGGGVLGLAPLRAFLPGPEDFAGGSGGGSGSGGPSAGFGVGFWSSSGAAPSSENFEDNSLFEEEGVTICTLEFFFGASVPVLSLVL